MGSHERSTSLTVPSRDDSRLHFKAQQLSSRPNRKPSRKLQGWRFGVAVSACLSLFVMVLNLAAVIVIFKRYGQSNQGGIVTAFTGSCDRVEKWTSAIHIIINGLSSILLGASNYTQQVMSSPTRGEVDSAHRKGDWVDIGVVSVRNIWGRISRQRILVWWVSMCTERLR